MVSKKNCEKTGRQEERATEADLKQNNWIDIILPDGKVILVQEFPVMQWEYFVQTGTTPSLFSHANHPVTNVDWNEAVAYCNKISARLLTEEEWEFCCLGGLAKDPFETMSQAKYGLYLQKHACCNVKPQKDKTHTCEVGSYEPNGYGLYDMLGNVWEWTSSLYMPGSPTRVNRGGCWFNNSADRVRAAVRDWYAPGGRDSNLGFRCARDPSATLDWRPGHSIPEDFYAF